MANERQCLGLVSGGRFFYRRCGMKGPGRFCGHHRLQWPRLVLLAVFVGAPAALGYRDFVTEVSEYVGGPSHDEIALRNDGYTKASGIAHGWKTRYYTLNPAVFDGPGTGNIWTTLEKFPAPTYDRATWDRYRVLFVDQINGMVGAFETLLATHGDVMPLHVRTLISQTAAQLRTDQNVYLIARQVEGALGGQVQAIFATPFAEVPRTLGRLDEEMQRLRDGE